MTMRCHVCGVASLLIHVPQNFNWTCHTLSMRGPDEPLWHTQGFPGYFFWKKSERFVVTLICAGRMLAAFV